MLTSPLRRLHKWTSKMAGCLPGRNSQCFAGMLGVHCAMAKVITATSAVVTFIKEGVVDDMVLS